MLGEVITRSTRSFKIIMNHFRVGEGGIRVRCWGKLFVLLKNKIQPNKSEDLTGFLKQFVNGVTSTRRVLRRAGQTEGVYRKKFGVRELPTEEKQRHLSSRWRGTGRGVIHSDHLFLWGWRGPK